MKLAESTPPPAGSSSSSSIKEGLVEEVHKPARRNFPRRSVIVKGIGDLWQGDLVEMIPYAGVNRGYKYLLTVIDCCSKFAWAQPVKSKSAEDITRAMETVLKTTSPPRLFQVDNGSEFYNKNFMALMKKHNIHLYSVFTKIKAAIVERFNRTLKTKMWKRFSLQGSYEWIKNIQQLVGEYNRSHHRSIGMKPIEAGPSNEKEILRKLRGRSIYATVPGAPPPESKFKVGDRVRISKQKALFEKGYTPNWSNEQFIIVKVQGTDPVTYILEDMEKQPIRGAFYKEELQKTRYEDVYLIEKVIRRSKGRCYVKWWGFDSKFNSWIDEKNVEGSAAAHSSR